MNEIYLLTINTEKLPSSYKEMLERVSNEKIKKIKNYKFDIDIKLSLYSDLLVRYLACQKLNLNNEKLTIEKNIYGKPYILGEANFNYNISHTHNAMSIAISENEVGIDIEKIGLCDFEIVNRYFSNAESEYIFSNNQEQNKRFYEIWTKKESFIKWDGRGLAVPLDSFNVLEKNSLIKSYIIGDYIISVCSKNKINNDIIYITENQLIEKALELCPSISLI